MRTKSNETRFIMVKEFDGTRCHSCGNERYAVYTLIRESSAQGLIYKAQAVCRNCGQIVKTACDPDERRAVNQVINALS